ncbi:MAG: DMT family transporter [Candidatus Paceibacterota bacterium]|jgi:drug/metabolite transporter (DMT)-like permease
MNWFFIALGAPFLWAIVNIADQYLVSKYSQKEKERSSGGLVLFSSLIGIFIAIGIGIFTSGIFDISFSDIILLLIAGGLAIIWIILYLYALEIENISVIVPWFLTVPIFGYILGFIFLGETLTFYQIIGSLIVFIGLVFISIDFFKEKKGIKRKMIYYMLFASLMVAISGIIFKYVTIEGNFWVSSFWEYFGLGLGGLFLYIFIPKYRHEFAYMNKIGGRKIFFVNIISELMTIFGNLLTNFALLLAPVAMVYLIGSFQPAIVLLLIIVGTKFFPHIIKENISHRVLIQKITAVIVMIIGSVFLFI